MEYRGNLPANPLPNEIDLAMDTQPHPMKETLDSGRLTWRSTNQDLVSFLDLHRKYHHEFLKRLENHVRDNGYGWQDLLEHESELAGCARGFVKKNGRRYWGSEESREKYFYKDAFRDPYALAVYPERKEEITRVVRLLLEKKARSVTTENQGRPRKRESIPEDFYIQSPEPVHDPLGAMLYDGKPLFTPEDSEPQPRAASTSKRKRRESSDHLLETPSTQKTTDFFDGRLTGFSQKDTRPFSSLMDSALDPSAKTQASTKAKHSTAVPVLALNGMEVQDEPLSTNSSTITSDMLARDNQPEVTTRNNNNVAGAEADPFVRLYLERSYYPERTTFLVSSNYQPDMGPVWIPFQDFSSVSSFLESMARECHPDEYYSWGVDKQKFTTTNTATSSTSPHWAIPYPSFSNVLAATVRLEWSELVVIRVRRGKDQDWAIFRRELQKAWASSSTTTTTSRTKNPCCESDLQGNPNDGDREQQQQEQAGAGEQQQQQHFKISVRLHIMD